MVLDDILLVSDTFQKLTLEIESARDEHLGVKFETMH
jgi:hypothetical protein